MSAYEDNKLVDFVSAVLSGLAISYRTQAVVSFAKPMWSTTGDIVSTVTYIGAYAVVSLLMFQWKSHTRIKYGWILIAVIGSILCAMADELIFSRSDPDDVLQGVSLFPIGFVFYLLLTCPIMAAGHYIGLVTRSKRVKWN